MYNQSVVVKVGSSDRELFFKEHPVLKVIDLPVSDEMVVRFKAMRMINQKLPTQECVTKVLNSVKNDDNTWTVRVSILD